MTLPENSSAYLVKLMIELKVHNFDELSNISTPLNDQKLFQRALKFATDEEKIKLERCIEVNNKNLNAKKQAENEQKYIKALTMKETISSSSDAQNLINLLNSILPYKDSEAIIWEIRPIKQKFEELENKYMNACIENRKNSIDNLNNPDIEKFNRIAEMFEALGDYKDSKKLAEEIRRSGIERIEKVKKGKQTKKILAITIAILIIVTCAIYGYKEISEHKAVKRAEDTRIEAEKNEEKSHIEALKLELQNQKLNKNGN